MRVGIQISINLKKCTGVEEYASNLLEKLFEIDDWKNHQFFIFNPDNLKWPFKFGWTQIRLSLEILKKKPDVLFVLAHTFPLIRPKKIITIIHGLEFEQRKQDYSFWQKKKLRFLTKRNAKKSKKIIVPSKHTKQDLINFYKIDPNKIFIVPPGIDYKKSSFSKKNNNPYILYLGSNHKRKNIDNLKKAYKILKEKYNIKHKLVLAGVRTSHRTMRGSTSPIIELGHVPENKKWKLIDNADIFVFPSFYEGFGIPPLEAQGRGVPVVASTCGAFPETLDKSALLVDPNKPKQIAQAIYKLIKNPKLKQRIIKNGYQNVKRLNWESSANKIFKIICESH